ncbi:hypothetical protein IT408_02385 [Candidatus Uhrbacteria bacterium]|nr:hypothetical protein [Candidatus Uhrbacteria bacterium]
MKKLSFSIEIHAPVQKVWDTMLLDPGYREWTKPFNPKGSWYEGTLEKGAEIRFIGPDEQGNLGGMMSRVKEFDLYHFISFEHYGQIQNGVEDTTSDQVKSWSGAYEDYTFTEKPEGKTLVETELAVPDEFTGYMESTWPAALEKLQKLSELSA